MRNRLALLFALLITGASSAAAEPGYPWLALAPTRPLADSFAPPDGFVRVATDAGSFAEWLQHLPLAPDGTPVRFHDGREKPDQSEVAAVIDIDVGSANLQQCADAIIRLRAEYLFGRGATRDLAFDFTSGDRYHFQSYAKGVTPAVSGAAVTWRTGQRQGLSHDSLRRWLDIVFTYAGTLSLSRELQPVPRLSDAAIGDVLVHGGTPGHAVLIVDLAVAPASGRKLALLAQGCPRRACTCCGTRSIPHSRPGSRWRMTGRSSCRHGCCGQTNCGGSSAARPPP
jgi:hypothetical protein